MIDISHCLGALDSPVTRQVTQQHVQFPAGLIDKGESASQSAVRELREETGEASGALAYPPKLLMAHFAESRQKLHSRAEQGSRPIAECLCEFCCACWAPFCRVAFLSDPLQKI